MSCPLKGRAVTQQLHEERKGLQSAVDNISFVTLSDGVRRNLSSLGGAVSGKCPWKKMLELQPVLRPDDLSLLVNLVTFQRQAYLTQGLRIRSYSPGTQAG